MGNGCRLRDNCLRETCFRQTGSFFLVVQFFVLTDFDLIIIGAGAAGFMCAMEAGKRGRRGLLLEKADKAGCRIRISGGGKSNFTSLDVHSENYLSRNPHFCKSALARYTQWDFMALISAHELTWEERNDELSSLTMEARQVPGLYFIGETVDVTGYLGGYHFQWAWTSDWCTGQFA